MLWRWARYRSVAVLWRAYRAREHVFGAHADVAWEYRKSYSVRLFAYDPEASIHNCRSTETVELCPLPLPHDDGTLPGDKVLWPKF